MNPEKAKVSDVSQIHKLINSFADKGEMLARSLSEIYENIRDYFVVRQDERIIACAALHVSWADLAEIRSLAVAAGCKGKGVGKMLINAAVDDAKSIGVKKLFALTCEKDFFERLGFKAIDKNTLPDKVWTACIVCPKADACDEIAMICEFQND